MVPQFIENLVHLEAREHGFNDLFNFAQDEPGISRGTIRATVLMT